MTARERALEVALRNMIAESESVSRPTRDAARAALAMPRAEGPDFAVRRIHFLEAESSALLAERDALLAERDALRKQVAS